MRKIPFFLILLVFGLFSAEGGAKPASDFYKILGVFPDASSDKLEEAYRRVKTRLRASPGNLESSKRLEELEEAYGALRDPRRRAEYNSWLKKAGFQEEPNFYKLFGVLSDSPAAKITRAYREILQRIHPDKNKGDPEANRRTQELKEAHRILSDPRLRLRHDRELRSFEGNLLESLGPAQEASGKEPSGASAETSPGAAPQGRAVKGGAKDEFGKTFARMQTEESLDQTLFNEEIFQLARELEAAGGEENIREAVSWYRMLAVDGHIAAARRLAPLLEDIDVEEALYRYRQGSADDSDREFSRAAVFREAQLYLNGVYEGDKAIIPKDPEKAAAAFERAVELGAPPAAVAREYDLIRGYEKAMEWQSRKKGQISGAKKKKKTGQDMAPAQRMSDTLVHQAVLMEDTNPGLASHHAALEQSILRMLRKIQGADWNAHSSSGRTALSLAAGRLYRNVVAFLIEKGADPAIPDASGFLPIHRALLRELSYHSAFEKRDDLKGILKLLHETRTARVAGKGHRSGETPIEIALGQGLLHRGTSNFIIADVYLDFIHETIRAEGVAYLSDEEFDRLTGKAMQRGAENTVDMLRLGKRLPEPPRLAPQKRGGGTAKKGWLSHFFDSLTAPRECRASFPSSKESGPNNPS